MSMSYDQRYIWDPDNIAFHDEEIVYHELFWRDYQPWLLERGYRLRARYQPGWVASWTTGTPKHIAEDSVQLAYGKIMDAVRISDGKLVALKRSSSVDDPHEVEIAELFSSQPLASDPRNHCVPIYESIPVPDLSHVIIIVMPLLYPLERPKFETVGEVIECFRQLFEGVQFIHEHNIAHRDCKYDSFLVDSQVLYRGINRLPHPSDLEERRDYHGPPRPATTRTRSPVKYYIIDFNLSRQYEGSGPRLEHPAWGGDKTVPEWRSDELCDPFPVDVYCLGNSLRENFTEGWDLGPGKKGFQFMVPLVNDMCQHDPKARPNMVEVVARFEKIRLGPSERKLRSRIARMDENPLAGAFRFLFHWGSQLVEICRRTPAIPTC